MINDFCSSTPLAAGVGLYGWGKQQAVNQTATSDALANQLTALQKAQESQKAELEGIIKQQAVQPEQANRQQETLAKQLDEVQQKVARFLPMLKKNCCALPAPVWPSPA